ncbi:MAG: hypothetical protein R3248_12835 [Candidatus Promineifilaceae bacterium]|nr:hypothetical protein [Candidatus Promineifilaceae bacterium]
MGKKVVVLIAVLALTLTFASQVGAGAFVHGVVVTVDGEDYYMAGAPDGPDGATDIPGHHWNMAGPNQLVAKHYNTGPFGAPQWWSSDAPDGELLYIVHAIIDTWSVEKAEAYAERGYIHYHELISVEDGTLHPSKVAWLKHTARTTFTLDGGPHPELAHVVTPGVDYEFIPNGMNPYSP